MRGLKSGVLVRETTDLVDNHIGEYLGYGDRAIMRTFMRPVDFKAIVHLRYRAVENRKDAESRNSMKAFGGAGKLRERNISRPWQSLPYATNHSNKAE